MAINYWRMGLKTAAQSTIVITGIASIALFVLLYLVPDDLKIPNEVFYVPQLIIVYLIANALQGDYIHAHERLGGSMASAWPSVGIGLLCLPIVLIVFVALALLLEPSFGTYAKFGEDEIYYSGDATNEDARELADALHEIEFFGSGGTSVKYEVSSDGSTVSFILIENAWEDPETANAFREIGDYLVESDFPSPMTIELCNGYFEVQRTFPIR